MIMASGHVLPPEGEQPITNGLWTRSILFEEQVCGGCKAHVVVMASLTSFGVVVDITQIT